MSCCLYTPMKYSYHDKAVWQRQLHCDVILFGLKSLDTVTINYPDRKREATSKAHVNNCKTTQRVHATRQRHPAAQLDSVSSGIYSKQRLIN